MEVFSSTITFVCTTVQHAHNAILTFRRRHPNVMDAETTLCAYRERAVKLMAVAGKCIRSISINQYLFEESIINFFLFDKKFG